MTTKRLLSTCIVAFYLFSLVVTPASAQNAIILTDDQLDGVYAEGLFFDFGASFGSVNDVVQETFTPGQTNSPSTVTHNNNPNITAINIGPVVPVSSTNNIQTTPAQAQTTPTQPTPQTPAIPQIGQVSSPLFGIHAGQTQNTTPNIASTTTNPNNTTLSTTNTASFDDVQNILNNAPLPLTDAAGNNFNIETPTLPSNVIGSNPAGGVTASDIANTPVTEFVNPIATTNNVTPTQTDIAQAPQNTATPTALPVIPAIPTLPTTQTPTVNTPTITLTTAPNETPALPNVPTVETINPQAPTINPPTTVIPDANTLLSPEDVLAGVNPAADLAGADVDTTSLPNNSNIAESSVSDDVVQLANLEVPGLPGTDVSIGASPISSGPSNVVNVTGLSQQNLSSLVNVNAAGSVVPVVLNITINIDSTIGSVTNTNNIDVTNLNGFSFQ